MSKERELAAFARKARMADLAMDSNKKCQFYQTNPHLMGTIALANLVCLARTPMKYTKKGIHVQTLSTFMRDCYEPYANCHTPRLTLVE